MLRRLEMMHFYEEYWQTDDASLFLARPGQEPLYLSMAEIKEINYRLEDTVDAVLGGRLPIGLPLLRIADGDAIHVLYKKCTRRADYQPGEVGFKLVGCRDVNRQLFKPASIRPGENEMVEFTVRAQFALEFP